MCQINCISTLWAQSPVLSGIVLSASIIITHSAQIHLNKYSWYLQVVTTCWNPREMSKFILSENYLEEAGDWDDGIEREEGQDKIRKTWLSFIFQFANQVSLLTLLNYSLWDFFRPPYNSAGNQCCSNKLKCDTQRLKKMGVCFGYSIHYFICTYKITVKAEKCKWVCSSQILGILSWWHIFADRRGAVCFWKWVIHLHSSGRKTEQYSKPSSGNVSISMLFRYSNTARFMNLPLLAC